MRRCCLGLLVLGQARQQPFGGGNTLSVYGFPGFEIGGGFEPLLFRGLLRRGPVSEKPLGHYPIPKFTATQTRGTVILRIPAGRGSPMYAWCERVLVKRLGKELPGELKLRNLAADSLPRIQALDEFRH